MKVTSALCHRSSLNPSSMRDFFAWTFLSQPYLQGTYFPLLLRGRRQHSFVIEALFINARYIFLNSTFHLFTLNLEYKLEYNSPAVRAIERASRWRFCKAGTTKRFTKKQWYKLLAGIHCSKLHMCVHYVCIHMMHTSLGQKIKFWIWVFLFGGQKYGQVRYPWKEL